MKPRDLLAPVVILAAIYISWCSGKQQGAADARLVDRGRATDSSAHVTDSRLARMAAESSMEVAQLRRLQREDSVSRREIARLRARITPMRDSALVRDSVQTFLAERDAVIAQQDSVIARQDSSLTLYQAMLAARDSVIPQLVRERDSYKAIAQAWQGKAQKRFGCVGGATVAVGLGGQTAVGAGLTCGWRL